MQVLPVFSIYKEVYMDTKLTRLLREEGDNFILPFFWQHGESEEVLRKYMQVIQESNIGAVCIESRPHPDFCGDKWWQDMDVILDEARKRNMKVWILDDSHFPTGFANGALAGQPDELCRQSICCRIFDPSDAECTNISPEGTFTMSPEEIRHPAPFQKNMIEQFTLQDLGREFDDDRLFALYALRFDKEDSVDLMPLVQKDTLCWQIPEGKWKIYALHLSRNRGFHRTYINMTSAASCRVLIDAVYEKHWEHYKDDFGTTIAGFFSDEPEFGNGHMFEQDDHFGMADWDYPWSQEVERELFSALGDQMPQYLSLLWEDQGDAATAARVRYTYMDIITRLVKENFSYQVGDWCRQHGVAYIGHIIEDNDHHCKTGSSLGHYFRSLAGQDMSGIDDIGGQVLPQQEHVSYNRGLFQRRDGEFYHYTLGKLGSSAAAIEPGKHGDSMCEIFGNYGWQEGVRLEKYLTDHFLVRGINHYVPHAFSPKEFPDSDCPPHFYAHGHNPQYRHFGYLMKYMNRVCNLISGGTHISPVALLYHGEAEWTGKYMTGETVAQHLCENQIEYDYIPQDVFLYPEEYHAAIGDGNLTVNTQQYSAVVVPYAQFITKEFAEWIPMLVQHDIHVYVIDDMPEGICNGAADHALMESVASSAQCVQLDDLVSVLRQQSIPELQILPGDAYLHYYHYVQPEGTQLYLFVNEGTETYQGQVSFAAPFPSHAAVYEYDAWNNAVYPVSLSDNGTACQLKLLLAPLKSMILMIDPSMEPADLPQILSVPTERILMEKKQEGFLTEIPAFSAPWKRSTCEAVSYPAFAGETNICLPDTLCQEQPDFSGFVRYDNTIVLTKEDLPAGKEERILLEITDAYEGVEVFVNGESLGIQIVPSFVFDLTHRLHTGENLIRIEVATTLERAMYSVPDRMGRPKPQPKDPSGINGEVHLYRISC